MRSPEARLLQHLVQLLRGLIALAAVTGVCFWLKLPLVSAALTYLIVILLLSFVSSLSSLLILCVVTAGCLDYFFTSPVLSFRIDHPEDVSGIAVFLVASLVVIGLVRRLQTEQRERRDSEERWKAVFENTPTMYFMLDAAGTVLSVNPFGAEQL
ncbi:MAG: DUF4118 domain-containing protein, partial [Terriglobales bacterium]